MSLCHTSTVTTMDLYTFEKENRDRIQAVENSFGPGGAQLAKPGRVLMGQGRLTKQGRRRPQNKIFFLFNDVLVYGSIILNGRWHKNMKVIALEDIQLEDMEDGEGFKNQWLMRTPRKSFFVSASSYDEKRTWMEHIEDCRSKMLEGGSSQPGSSFAVAWIPDPAAFKCMRCFNNFTATKRRHHCRKCGFLVCNSCSKRRAVISHIHPTKQLRVCNLCSTMDQKDDATRQRGDSTGKTSSEEDYEAASSEEEEGEMVIQYHPHSSWLDSQTGTYDYPRPMSEREPATLPINLDF